MRDGNERGTDSVARARARSFSLSLRSTFDREFHAAKMKSLLINDPELRSPALFLQLGLLLQAPNKVLAQTSVYV